MPTARKSANNFQKYSDPVPEEPVSDTSNLNWIILLGCVFTGVVSLVTPGFIGWVTLAISVVLGLLFIFNLLPPHIKEYLSEIFDNGF